MKQLVLLSAFIFFSLLVSSQQKIEVETGEKSMSKGQQMAVIVLIPEAKLSTVEPLWKKYVNNRGFGERVGNLATQIGNIFKSEENMSSRDKLKVEKKEDEWYVRSIEEATITKHSMDIYARMTEQPDGCQFHAFFQYTDSTFINESNADPERIQNMKNYIRDFAVEAYKSEVDNQIKEAKKEVSSQEDVLKDIESLNKKEEKSITRYEADIQELNAGVFEVESDIVRLDEVITAKKVTFTTLSKKTPEYGTAKKELKVLTKEKSKYFNKVKSLKEKIKSKEQDIKSAQGKIADNELKLVHQRMVIQEKGLIVEQLTQKKTNIQ